MTVAELIEVLKDYPPGARVKAYNSRGWFQTIEEWWFEKELDSEGNDVVVFNPD